MTSRALLKAAATVSLSTLFCDRKMRLDDCAAVRLIGVMAKSSSKKRSIAVILAGGDDETAGGRLLSVADTRGACRNFLVRTFKAEKAETGERRTG
jgi:hypothetical protein